MKKPTSKNEQSLRLVQVQLDGIISKLISMDINPKLFFSKVLSESFGVTDGQEVLNRTISKRGA